MTYRNSPNRTVQSVPLHLAQRIEAERDALVEEVRRLKDVGRNNDQLQAEVHRLQSENHRLSEAVEAAANQKLNDATTSHPKVESPAVDENAIKQLSRRIQELESDLSRSHRRSETEVDTARRDQRAKLLSGLGEVCDSTDLALRMNPSAGPWREGLIAIRDQLTRFMASHGAKLIGEVGDTLDPRVHEAIAMVESPDFERGKIVEVHRQGIMLEDGSVARTALVAVAS